jgi:hypothetical protein
LIVWFGLKPVLMHLRILPDHQKLFFKKVILNVWSWAKTCFDAFSHTSIRTEKCLKKDILKRLEWLKMCFNAFAHTSRPAETFFKKDIFDRLEW